MAKPSIIVNSGSAGVKAAVSASSAWTATLDSTDGVRRVTWSVSSTDETTTAASYTLVQSGSVGQTVAGTSQGQGTAIILHVVVNAGINAATGQADPENTSATVKIYVPLADGGEVGCAGEEYESDATFGATGIINAGIRKAALLSPSGVPVKIVRTATAAALPANTRAANVLTADANGAIGTVGGVAVTDGDYILVQNEGGGASHINNGPFVLADGDGSNPWTLTRAAYFDDSAELIAMTTFRIQEGTYAGKERYLVTSGATINVTALEFAAFGYAPNDAAFLTVGAVSDLSAERNISAVTSTLTFESTTVAPLGAKRTDSATAALVDVAEVTALSSGSAAAGFGPAALFKGEVGGGGAENYGRVGFAAVDLTGSSEDTKAVLQTRTAGSALASVAEFSGTAVTIAALAGSGTAGVEVDGSGNLTRGAGGGASASAYYLTDAAAIVNTDDVPIQALAATLEFARASGAPVKFTHKTSSTATTTEAARFRQQVTSGGGVGTGGEGVKATWALPNGSGTETIAGSIRAVSTSVFGSLSSKLVIATTNSGTETDWVTLAGNGALRLHSSDYAHDGYRLVVDVDGNVSASIITFAEVQTALAALFAGVLHADGAGSLTSSAIVNADVSASAAIAGTKISPDFGSQNVTTTGTYTSGTGGFIGPQINRATSGTFTFGSNITTLAGTALAATGVASIDNSGGTLTVGGNTTGQTFGKASTIFALLGNVTIAGTTGHSDSVTITKDALGTTKTRGFTVVNTTVSGSQITAQIGLSASHSGGTQHNIGWQIEPQSSSNALSVWYYGTGTGAPASTAFYHASSDGNFGSAVFADAWVCRSTSVIGFRFDQDSNRGGMDQDGANNLRVKSYSGKGITLSIYSDAGSTLTSNPITVNGSGQGYAQFIPTTPTSASNAVTFNLTTSQHVDHTLTENTTVTITGGVNGQEGSIVFSQPASAKTVTMPTNGVGVEYAADVLALTLTGIVDTTNLSRTVLSYRVLANGKAFIKHRATGLIP